MHARRITTIAITAAMALLLVVPAAFAFNDYAGTFQDEDGNVHEANIEAIFDADITDGCNPPENDEYCPDDDVTRGQMAKFLDRARDVEGDDLDSFNDTDEDFFTDDEDSIFEGSINRLAANDVTDGCNPPDDDEYCPEDFITRGQMAKFLVATFELPASDEDAFTDDEDSIFEDDINAVAAAGVTLGCNPPDDDEYCPEDNVSRDQMASFIARALGIDGDAQDPTPFEGQTTCDPAYNPCVPTVEEFGDLNCDDIREEYPEGVAYDSDFEDSHDLNRDGDDMACEPADA